MELNDTIEVVEFLLGDSRYAIDIQLVREVFEMVPMTVIPHTPQHIAGVINIRGEITYLVNIATLLRIAEAGEPDRKYIIVLTGDATAGTNIGIMVDSVTSVTRVDESRVEYKVSGMSGEGEQYIRGIISQADPDRSAGATRLVLWLDARKMLSEINRKEYHRAGQK